MVGVNTKIITAIEVTAPRVGDSTQFMPLLNRTARAFNMREVSADKAYLSNAIVEAVVDAGAHPYIPFRSNCNGRMGGTLWRQIFSDFTERPDEFYAHYHKRSNVESAFSMMKANSAHSYALKPRRRKSMKCSVRRFATTFACWQAQPPHDGLRDEPNQEAAF